MGYKCAPICLRRAHLSSAATQNATKKCNPLEQDTSVTSTATDEERKGIAEAKIKNDLKRHQRRAFRSSDVWYRRIVKPLARKTPLLSYQDSFKRRVLNPAGIPVQQLSGLHEVFLPEYCQYSPLVGMIFSYNNFIDNLYRDGDSNEAAVVLVRSLFHALPGGVVQPTHLGKCVGAHLSAAIIGEIFRVVEQTDPQDCRSLVKRLSTTITTHRDYQEEVQRLVDGLTKAEADLKALSRRDEESKPTRSKIRKLEGEVIKRLRHQIKRAEKALENEKEAQYILTLKSEIKRLNDAMGVALQEIEELRKRIVTSGDFKVARKAVNRARDMIQLEEQNRDAFMCQLADTFSTYELAGACSSRALPKYTTTAILLGFIWRKYDSIDSLNDYFQVMKQVGALNCDFATVAARIEANLSLSANTLARTTFPRYRKWSSSHISDAVMMVILKPGVSRRPRVIPFSYVKWAQYSEFADCGETALRNLFNQLLFNPATGRFDFELLSELKEEYYPRMQNKLIDFYEKHSRPQDCDSHLAAKDWIRVVSKLNRVASHGPFIRYRREKRQQNIASPLSNLLNVFYALLGVAPLDQAQLKEVIQHINQLRGWDLRIDTSRIRDNGFGIVGLSDGHVCYELQSFKPVHFGFSQVETLELDSLGRRNFTVFQGLQKYSCGPPKFANEKPAYFQQLSLASLFVPYDLQCKKDSRFFRREASCLRTTFADLVTSSSLTGAPSSRSFKPSLVT